MATEIIQKENLTVDVGKTLKMIAFHDIGEAIAQDYTPLDKVSPEQKYQEEYSAIKEISYKSQMPELLSLWVEFEEGETVEATFAKRIDKLDAVLQAEVYAEKGNLPNLPVEFYEHSKGVIGDFDKYVDDSTKNSNQESVW